MEEMDFQGLLDRFRDGGFTRGEAVILANFGTNQTLLSIIYGKACELELQKQTNDTVEIQRYVVLKFGGIVGCGAITTMPVNRNRKDVLDLVTKGQIGLGQVVTKLNLPNRRILLDIDRDKDTFQRTYAIEGPDVYMRIFEYFPRLPLLAAGWDVDWVGK